MPRPRSLRVGIATCGAAKLAAYFPTAAEPDLLPTEPPFTPDDQRLVDALRRRGHHVAAVEWGGDISALRSTFDRLIVRSPWDYMDSDDSRQAFLAWLDTLGRAGVAVDNDLGLMLWLMDKRYLLDFAAVGVAIVPTTIVPIGETLDLVEQQARLGALVIKPAISAAGAGLEFVPTRAMAQTFQAEFDERCRRSAQLVQPFLSEIQSRGEWSLVYLGGQYSHAVHKLPAADKILVHAEQGGSLRFANPPATVQAAADQVAAACLAAYAYRGGSLSSAPLYLRIDIIETAAGPRLSECEGVEPELFFRARPGSEERCAELIETRAAAES